MKYKTRVVATIIFFLTSTVIYSQIFTSYRYNSIEISSDVHPKCVLLSNLFDQRVGDNSPVMGVALWQDSNKIYECRSMIQFDLNMLHVRINNADMIESATLILYPKQIGEKNNDTSLFVVKRILQPWADSLAIWDNQPATQLSDLINVKVTPKQKNKSLKIDVTKMVREMFSHGNNGFMIASQDPANAAISQWFASAKSDDIKTRPLLLIQYAVPYIINNYNTAEPPHIRYDLNSIPPATTHPPIVSPRNN